MQQQMMDSTRKGCWGEERVLRLLRRREWQLVSQRWSCRYGELDLVLEKQQRLLVVEVIVEEVTEAYRPLRYSLVMWMIDPELEWLQTQAVEAAQEGSGG